MAKRRKEREENKGEINVRRNRKVQKRKAINIKNI